MAGSHEGGPRRWYGGAVGMIGFDGAMNTGLTLRTAHIRDGVAAVRAGATLLTWDAHFRLLPRCRAILFDSSSGAKSTPA